MNASFRLGISPSMAYTLIVAWAIVVLALGVGMAAVVGADNTGDELTTETVEFTNSTDPITVGVDWNGSIASSTETADVTVLGESAHQINGTDVTGDLATETLNGTVAEFENVTAYTTYDIQLDQSATTVTLASSDIADDGTVDLSAHTSDSLTADDTVLSVTASADTVLSESFAADAGNVTEVDYNETDGLTKGETYRVFVHGTDAEIDDVWIETGGGPLFGGSESGGPLLGGLAVIAVVIVAIYARGSE